MSDKHLLLVRLKGKSDELTQIYEFYVITVKPC